MARRSLAAFLLIAPVLLMAGLNEGWAKEKFVKYSEAMRSVSTLPPNSVSVEEVYQLIQKNKKIIIYDARQKTDHLKQRIVGALLPLSDEYYKAEKLFRENITRTRPDFAVYLKSSTSKIPKDSQIITYCNRNCGLSKTLANELKALGFADVRWMNGGIDSWQEKGYPLES